MEVRGQEEEKEYRVIRQVIRNLNINKTTQNKEGYVCIHTHTFLWYQCICKYIYICIVNIYNTHRVKVKSLSRVRLFVTRLQITLCYCMSDSL